MFTSLQAIVPLSYSVKSSRNHIFQRYKKRLNIAVIILQCFRVKNAVCSTLSVVHKPNSMALGKTAIYHMVDVAEGLNDGSTRAVP